MLFKIFFLLFALALCAADEMFDCKADRAPPSEKDLLLGEPLL